jgi:hypothetical protein
VGRQRLSLSRWKGQEVEWELAYIKEICKEASAHRLRRKGSMARKILDEVPHFLPFTTVHDESHLASSSIMSGAT